MSHLKLPVWLGRKSGMLLKAERFGSGEKDADWLMGQEFPNRKNGTAFPEVPFLSETRCSIHFQTVISGNFFVNG